MEIIISFPEIGFSSLILQFGKRLDELKTSPCRNFVNIENSTWNFANRGSDVPLIVIPVRADERQRASWPPQWRDNPPIGGTGISFVYPWLWSMCVQLCHRCIQCIQDIRAAELSSGSFPTWVMIVPFSRLFIPPANRVGDAAVNWRPCFTICWMVPTN